MKGDTIQIELADLQDAGARVALGRVGGVDEVKLDGRLLRARAQDGSAAIPAVLAALEAHGVKATSVTLARPSLDDVYLRHAGRAFDRANNEHEEATT
jgi:ABC-2 type transport system ATP-binding protein